MTMVQYWGTANYNEKPLTGRNALWITGMKQDVTSTIAAQLVGAAVGFQYDTDDLPYETAKVTSDGGIVLGDGSIYTLSEVSPYVAATPSAGATVATGACEYAGYVCTTAAGNITVYDNTSAAGTVIVPTTALAVGAFPIFGAGTNGKMALTTGCHVVLSGAATVNVLVG